MVDTFSHSSDEPVPLIDSPQQGAVVDDIPHPVVYLLESDVLVMESIAEEGLLCLQPERPRARTGCLRRFRCAAASLYSAFGTDRTSAAGSRATPIRAIGSRGRPGAVQTGRRAVVPRFGSTPAGVRGAPAHPCS